MDSVTGKGRFVGWVLIIFGNSGEERHHFPKSKEEDFKALRSEADGKGFGVQTYRLYTHQTERENEDQA